MAVEKTRVSYVSSDWSGKKAGDVISYDKTTQLVFGEDAFATVAAAVKADPNTLQIVVVDAKFTPSAADVAELQNLGSKKVELMSAPLAETEKSGTTTRTSAAKNDFVKTSGGLSNAHLTGYKNVTVSGGDLGLISAGALTNGYAGTEKETVKNSKTGTTIANDNKYTAVGVLDLTSTNADGIAGYQKVTLKGSSWTVGYVRGGKITEKSSTTGGGTDDSSSVQNTKSADAALVASNGAIGDGAGVAIDNFKTVTLTNVEVEGDVSATKESEKATSKHTAVSSKGQLKVTDSPENKNYNNKYTMDGTATLDKTSVTGALVGFKTITVQNGSSIDGNVYGYDSNETESSKDEVTYTGSKPEENPETWSRKLTVTQKRTITGKSTLTATSSSISSLRGVAKLTATNATIGDVMNIKSTENTSYKLTSSGKGKVETGTLTTEKEEYSKSTQNASSGTLTATNSSFDTIANYATVTLSKTTGDLLFAGTTKMTNKEDSTRTSTTIKGTATRTATYTPAGTLTLASSSSASSAVGFDKVTLTGGSSLGRVERYSFALPDDDEGFYSFGAGTLTQTAQIGMSGSKVVVTQTAVFAGKKGGTFTMTTGSVGEILNYATVTITSGSVAGDIYHELITKGTYQRKGTAASLSAMDESGFDFGDWEETSETAAANGKCTLTDTSVAGNIIGYATVTVKGVKNSVNVDGSISGWSWTEGEKKGVYEESWKTTGKVELNNVVINGSITGYATVNLNNVSTTNPDEEWISGGNETWNEDDEMVAFDLSGTLKGTNVALDSTTIGNYKTITLTDSSVGGISVDSSIAPKAAGKITLTNCIVGDISGYKTLDVKNTAAAKEKEAGNSEIGSYTGTGVADAVKFVNGDVLAEALLFGAGNDKLTIDKNTKAIVGDLNWGDGADSLTLNGMILVETTSDLTSWQGVKYSGSGILAVGSDDLYEFLSNENLGKIQLTKAVG